MGCLDWNCYYCYCEILDLHASFLFFFLLSTISLLFVGLGYLLFAWVASVSTILDMDEISRALDSCIAGNGLLVLYFMSENVSICHSRKIQLLLVTEGRSSENTVEHKIPPTWFWENEFHRVHELAFDGRELYVCAYPICPKESSLYLRACICHSYNNCDAAVY